MRSSKRRYKSKNQKAALAGFTFGMVFLGIVMLVVLTAQAPTYDTDKNMRHQDEIIAEFIHRVDGRGQF